MILKRKVRPPISAFYEGLTNIDIDENWLLNELKLVPEKSYDSPKIYHYKAIFTHKKTDTKTAIVDVTLDIYPKTHTGHIIGRSKQYSFAIELPVATTDILYAIKYAVKNPLFIASIYAMELNMRDTKQKRAVKEKFGEIFDEKIGGVINDNNPF